MTDTGRPLLTSQSSMQEDEDIFQYIWRKQRKVYRKNLKFALIYGLITNIIFYIYDHFRPTPISKVQKRLDAAKRELKACKESSNPNKKRMALLRNYIKNCDDIIVALATTPRSNGMMGFIMGQLQNMTNPEEPQREKTPEEKAEMQSQFVEKAISLALSFIPSFFAKKYFEHTGGNSIVFFIPDLEESLFTKILSFGCKSDFARPGVVSFRVFLFIFTRFLRPFLRILIKPSTKPLTIAQRLKYKERIEKTRNQFARPNGEKEQPAVARKVISIDEFKGNEDLLEMYSDIATMPELSEDAFSATEDELLMDSKPATMKSMQQFMNKEGMNNNEQQQHDERTDIGAIEETEVIQEAVNY